jgi:TRAP-type C4-dicarboxylate transport system permease small subunit
MPDEPARGLLDRLGRIQHTLASVLLAGAAVGVAVMALSVAANTIGRWLFGGGVGPGEELARYAMAVTVYFALAATLRDGSFIRVEVVWSKARGRLRTALAYAHVLLSLALSALVLSAVANETLAVHRRNVRGRGNLELPLVWPYALVALGLAVLALQLLSMLRRRALPVASQAVVPAKELAAFPAAVAVATPEPSEDS